MLPFSHSLPGLILAALLSLCAGGLASARPWTNTEGKTIEAEYVSHTSTAVVLSINGKQVTYATDKLSQADRDYLAGLDAAPAVPKGPVVKGKREGLKFTTYLFPTWEDYYKDRDRKSVLKGFENGAFNNTQWGKTEEWLKRDAEKDTYRMVVPPSYDGTQPYGLLLYINSGDPGSIPEQWHPLLDEMKLIAVAAENIGNNHPMMRRVQWSMDALANVEKEYRIDPARRVVTGISGGGHMAMLTAAMYPEHFAGAISHAAQSYLPDARGFGHFPGLELSDFKSKERKKLKWMVISGDKDQNYQTIIQTSKEWDAANLNYRFLDVPGMGHVPAAAAPMKEALEWIGLGG